MTLRLPFLPKRTALGAQGRLLRGFLLAFLGLVLAEPGRAQGPYDPGSALHFDGGVRYVTVPHAAALNSYPFTVSAWIRTTESSATVRGVVSKYADGSGNGWSVLLNGGKIQAFYATTAGGSVFRSPLGLDGGSVADGAWHHVVFTVGPGGGRLYVDSLLKETLGWSPAGPAASTSTQPMLIGRYSGSPYPCFTGDLDEVTLWSRELDANYVRLLGQRGPLGTEAGLVGSWRVDNGAGPALTDSTAASRHGTLVNAPEWIPSDAPVRRTDSAGDAWWNVLGSLSTATFSRTWLITDSPDPSPPAVNVTGNLIRLDDPNLPIAAVAVPVTFTVTVADAGDNTPVPLAQDTFTQSVTINSRSSSPAVPAVSPVAATIPLTPAAGLAAYLPGRSYRATVTMTHQESDGSVLAGGNVTTTAANFTVLSGHLFFGGLGGTETIFTSLGSAPAPSGGNVILTIPAGGAYLAGWPERTFGGTFTATIDPVTHHAVSVSGTATVTGPAVDTETVNGIRIRRGAITLRSVAIAGLFPAGASASVTVFFPTGFGYSLTDQTRLLEPSISFSPALGQDLRPVNPLLVYAPGTLFVCEESKPLLIKAAGIECDLALGVVRATGLISAQSVRKKEVSDLAAATGLAAGAGKKASNDAWLEKAATISGPVEARVGPGGTARLYAAGIGMAAHSFATHLPNGASVVISGGTVSIADDQFTSTGGVTLAAPLLIPQGRDCAVCVDSGTGIGPLGLAFVSNNGMLGITPDGGLVAEGALSAPTDIRWGYRGAAEFAQTVHGVTAGSFMSPGFALRGDQTTLAASDRPGVLLHTGSSTLPADGLYPPERPGTAAYTAGAASYGGFNFAIPADGALLASCRLGDQLFVNKPLRACCKYYARSSGISGLHQVLRGSIAGTFVVDGFNLQIDRYRLSFLGNENMDSGINGVLTVGGYSRFSQDFEKLYLNCFGRMSRLEMPAVTVKKNLFYWNAEIRPLTVGFANGGTCPPAVMPPPVLVVSCEAWVSHVQPTLVGRLAIDARGRLLPKAELSAYLSEYPDLDSVLHLPGTIPLRGPQGSSYSLVPNTPAYFSKPAAADPPDVATPNGFLHFAAKTDVAFFEDLRVHVHTSGQQGNTTSPLDLMGGWNEAGRTYWTQATFDPGHAGVPPGVTKEAYRANNNPAWLVKATRNWKGIVKIQDCPLKWNNGARLFSTLEGCNTELPIFNVETRINALGPNKTDLRFSKDFLPNFSLGNLAINELTEATGVITAFNNAGAGLKREVMQRGLESMETMLQNQIRSLIEAPLNRAIDPVADELAVRLNMKLNLSPPGDGPGLRKTFDDAFDSGLVSTFQGQIQSALGTVGDATSVLGEIRRRVVEGRAAAQSIRGILARDGAGKRHLLPNLAEQLLQQFNAPVLSQLGGAAVRQFLEVEAGELEEAFAGLDDTLGGLDAAFARILTSLDAAGNFAAEVKTRLNAIQPEILAAIHAAQTEIGTRFTGYNVPAMNLSAPAAVENLKQDIRRILRERLLASRVSTEMQRILRERLADVNDAMGSAMDSVFQQINDMVRSALAKATAGLAGEFQRFTGAAGGGIADSGAVAKINGHAVILGDKLNLLRVDGEFKLSFLGENGAELNLHAFLEVKDVSSRGGPGCGASAGKELTEITIGAEQVKLGWKAGPSLIADLGVKFTLEGTESSAVPVNFGGYVKVTGGLDFAVLKIKQIALAVAVGKKEIFLSAGARVEVSGWEFAGGFFAGKACSLEPILLWAPDARQVIGRAADAADQSFLGVYFYAEGWIPLNELLGIPSSCLLSIKVGAGMGFFVNLAGAEPEIGAKFLLGLDGDIICLIGFHAEFILRGRKRGLDFSTDGLRMTGEGSLCVEIGPCPFCVDICASLTLIYDGGNWDYEL